MKRVLVTGAGGFIGHHLVSYLKRKGDWVRGADLKHPEYAPSAADDFALLRPAPVGEPPGRRPMESTRCTRSPPTWEEWVSSRRITPRFSATIR